MFPLFSEIVLRTPALLKGDVFPVYSFEISLILVIICISAFDICNRKNGLFLKIKKFKRLVELVNQYPGLNFYPLIGSTAEMAHLFFQPCRDLIPWMRRQAESCGPIFRFWIYNQPKLVITCPETAVACLKANHFPARPIEIIEMGRASGKDTLLAIAPDMHSPRKKIWMQWFTRRIINGNLEMFQKEAIRLSEALSVETNKTFDFVDYALHSAFRTIACSAFGEEYVNSISEVDTKQHFHGLTTIYVNLFSRKFRPWLANDFLYYNFTVDGRETMKCVKSAHDLVNNAIKQAKTLRNNKIKQKCSANYVPCFLDHLLNIQERGDLTENEIFKELKDFVIAGYDTAGLSLSWTLYLLALHPEYQTKIVDELGKIFNGNMKHFSSKVTARHLQSMKYLELCIKESLRLYPVLAIILRRSSSDKNVVMPDGKIVPSGVDMYIPLRIIHKDPKYFPEPEKFVPERHLVSKPAYLPFGLGRRNCPGQVYSIQEMKMILACLLIEYKWETLEKPGLEPLMVPTSYPENGIRFRITKRNDV